MATTTHPAHAPALPAGWEERVSASKGRAYYVHKETGKTTWVHPLKSQTAAARRPAPRSLAIASVDDAPAVPTCLIEQVGDGMFPVMIKAGTPAEAVVGVIVPPGCAGAGRLVTVMVPAGVPTDTCFWIVAPLPKGGALSREDSSDSWSSAAGSAASTVLHDSASASERGEQDLDALDDCEGEGWDFEKYELEVRATAKAVRELAAARNYSPDYTMLAPEEVAAPALLISRTPSPQAVASPRGASQPQPAENAENPFRKQLHLLRGAETHNETLMNAASLPADWEKKMSASKGKPYYYNKVTGETSWVLPKQ